MVVWPVFYTVFFSKNNKFIFNRKLKISTVFSLQTTTITKQTRFKLLQFHSVTCLEQISFVKAIRNKKMYILQTELLFDMYIAYAAPLGQNLAFSISVPRPLFAYTSKAQALLTLLKQAM